MSDSATDLLLTNQQITLECRNVTYRPKSSEAFCLKVAFVYNKNLTTFHRKSQRRHTERCLWKIYTRSTYGYPWTIWCRKNDIFECFIWFQVSILLYFRLR